MKYTVIIKGTPYAVCADVMEEDDGLVKFSNLGGVMVAEFQANRVDGIIWEDNNVS